MTEKGHVYSCNGELVIDESGKVIVGESVYNNDDLKCIHRFDLKEHRKTYPDYPVNDYDILDLGYWTKDGQYEPPARDWREIVQEIKVR